MELPLRLRWRLGRNRNDARNAAARQVREEGRDKATLLLDGLKGELFGACLRDAALAKYVADGGEKLLLSVELQYLWGFFHEHVQGHATPVNGYDRIKLHLIDWLTSSRGYDLDSAGSEANAVEQRFNKADPLFEQISRLGRVGYSVPQYDAWVIVVRVLMKR